MRMDFPDGRWCDIGLIRSVEWIEQNHVHVGEKVFLDLTDVGVRGWADVLEVSLCEHKELSEVGVQGEMVTGTFKYSHGRIGELVVESEPKPIGVTPTHLVWSEDRQTWVEVSKLRPGETVNTLNGLTRVVSFRMTDRVEPVYNLEVAYEHCYRVGESGVLVHNQSAPVPASNGDCNEPCHETRSDQELQELVVNIHQHLRHFLGRALRVTAIAILECEGGECRYVYSVSGGFREPGLARAAEAAGFDEWIPGSEHAEENILHNVPVGCSIAKMAVCKPPCGPEDHDCVRQLSDANVDVIYPESNRCRNA
jgi:hypothetical protein